MARNVFFSFHYEDVKSFRANVVRQSWRFNKNAGKDSIFSDGSIWEEAKKKGVADLKKLIEETGLYKTSVTAVLIGSNTYDRRWVRYELVKSFEKGNGILGIYINRIKDKTGCIAARGDNPLDQLAFKVNSENNKVDFFEFKNSRWLKYADLPLINNKKSNSIYYGPYNEWAFFDFRYNKVHRFSEYFKTYCWDNDNGPKNISNWIEDAFGTKTFN